MTCVGHLYHGVDECVAALRSGEHPLERIGGTTPLHAAVEKRRVQLVELFVCALTGPPDWEQPWVTACDGAGRTVHDIADAQHEAAGGWADEGIIAQVCRQPPPTASGFVRAGTVVWPSSFLPQHTTPVSSTAQVCSSPPLTVTGLTNAGTVA